MPLGAHVARIEVSAPSRTARDSAEIALSRCGRARATVVLVVGDDPHPGRCVAPWTVDGLTAVAATRGLATRFWSPDSGAATRRMAARGVPAIASGPSTLVRAPGPRRPLRVPSAWIGCHAVVLVPCIYDGASDRGPVAQALATLAATRTTETLRDPVATGRWLVEHVFAGAGVIVDASWATTLGRDGPTLAPAGQLYAADRFDPDALDRQLQRDLFATVTRARALSDRNVGGLWRRPSRDPHVPGPLARAWHAYPGPSDPAEGTP